LTYHRTEYCSITGAANSIGTIQHPYNDKWSCPLTPAENRIKVAVRAGEKVFGGHADAESEGYG
jgi:hypothetical protein